MNCRASLPEILRLLNNIAEKFMFSFFKKNLSGNKKNPIKEFGTDCEFTPILKNDMTRWRAFDFCALPKEKSLK
jgi:hypothetical protein